MAINGRQHAWASTVTRAIVVGHAPFGRGVTLQHRFHRGVAVGAATPHCITHSVYTERQTEQARFGPNHQEAGWRREYKATSIPCQKLAARTRWSRRINRWVVWCCHHVLDGGSARCNNALRSSLLPIFCAIQADDRTRRTFWWAAGLFGAVCAPRRWLRAFLPSDLPKHTRHCLLTLHSWQTILLCSLLWSFPLRDIRQGMQQDSALCATRCNCVL